jgi:uncharacterized membrane protein
MQQARASGFEGEFMADSSNEEQSQVAISEKHTDLVSSILWLAFGAFVIWQSTKLDYRDEFGPSAGFFPFWLGVICIVLGGTLGVQGALRKAHQREIALASRSAAVRMLLLAVCLFAFVAAINTAGFFLAAGLLFCVVLYVIEKKSMLYSLLAGVLALAGFWLLFEFALKLQLPVGFMKFMRVI